MNNLKVLPYKFDEIESDIEDESKVDICLKFSKRISDRMYDEFKEMKIKHNDDGSYEITFRMSNDDELVNFILSFGSYVQINKLDWLREEIKTKCFKVLSNSS